MKHYPSIPKFNRGGIKLYTFDKLDGSNIRSEWSKKRGWFKFGTRNRLFDETDEIFGTAIPLFKSTLAEPLEKIFVDNRWSDVIIFGEFYGEKSFAGHHDKDDPKKITIFDINPVKKGFISPQEFLKQFEAFGPKFLGNFNWGVEFINQVRNNKIEGITFEGVVGKVKQGNQLIMYKAKTQSWIDKVKSLYDKDTAEKIINS